MQCQAVRKDGLFTIQPQDIDRDWHHVEPHLKRLERETLRVSPERIRQRCKDGKFQLWGFHDGRSVIAAMVTEVYEVPRGKICCIYALCGAQTESGQIESGIEAVKNWARSIGCIALEIQGRFGWERKLTGFKKTAVVLECEL